MTHVKLMGEMGEKFGAEWNMDVSNFRDVFRLIDCQTNGFKQYLTDCAEEGINFTIQNGEDLVDGTLDAMIAPVKDIVVITPVAAGAGMKDILKVVFGVFLLMYGPGMAEGLFAGPLKGAQDAAVVANSASGGSQIAATDAAVKIERIQKAQAFTTKAIQGVGTNLALSGVQGYLTPDTPSTSGKSYLFNGPENNVKEGVPVPLLYGQLMVGGSVINFGVEEEALPPLGLQGYTRITDGSSSWTTSDGSSGGNSGKDKGITHAF